VLTTMKPVVAFPPCPYSVTGLAIEYIEDSYLLSGVMVLSRPSV